MSQPGEMSLGVKLAIGAGILVVLYLLFKDKVDAVLAPTPVVNISNTPGLVGPGGVYRPPATPVGPVPVVPVAPPAPKYPTDWSCVGDIDVPIRREANPANDISCMAENGRDCVWGDCKEKLRYYSMPENSGKINPLMCGPMHASLYGDAGYTNPAHWCAKGNTLISKI